jgi:glycosyltransferase involved in cell wall biosynthesis
VKPVLFVTGHVPRERHAGFRELHDRQGIELALFGGPDAHGGAGAGPPPGVPSGEVSQADVGRLVGSGDYRAVILGTGGRLALPAAWIAARRARLPFVLWAAIWRTPRTPAHLAGLPLMLWIYRDAAAIVTYGEHVSGYVAARGARNIRIAPQAVDNDFWSVGAPVGRPPGPMRVLFVGRSIPAKGLDVLCRAWVQSRLAERGATLTLVGDHAGRQLAGVVAAGRVDRPELRNFYGSADVLVIPSIPTPAFVEPWGLVANEAMNQRTAIITTDAVGAAAGGMLRHRRNALVVAAGDPSGLADALVTLERDAALRARLADAGTRDVRAFTHAAWADAFSGALDSVGVGRGSLGGAGGSLGGAGAGRGPAGGVGGGRDPLVACPDAAL